VDSVIVEKYLWQGLTRLLALYDGSDNLLMRFEYADGRIPVAMTKGGVTYFLIYDQVGSLRVVADTSGNVVKRIEYDSFGNIIDDTNTSFMVPFGFAGGLHDRNTKLVRFGYRDYDPNVGRWTAKDPLLFAGGDTDLYGYILNDPVSFVDPYGLWILDIGFTGGGSGNSALNVGIQVGSTGFNAYYGVGLGGGAGLSATISTADPSKGVSVSGTARGGTGTLGAFGNISVNSDNGSVKPSVGFGWGIGWGVSVGATHTFGFSWDEIIQKFNQLFQPTPLTRNEMGPCY
jgi:RHS repeat-associated protein